MIMRAFSLFELFLTVVAIYALFKFEGGTRIVVPSLCLVVVFLFERLRKKPVEGETKKKKIVKQNRIHYKEYNIEEQKNLGQPEEWGA
jgi:hypothetical protein